MAVMKIPETEEVCPKCGRLLLQETDEDGKPIKRCIFENLIFVVDPRLSASGKYIDDGKE